MAGIGKAGGAGNILNFHIRFGKKQLPGTADAVHGNVFIDRTAKKTLEQTGKILRGYKDTLTEFGSGDVLLITGFNFFYYREQHISGKEGYPEFSEKRRSP